jgi:protein-disulfide isomerase
MIPRSFRPLALAAFAAPLALALSACGSGDSAGNGAAPSGEPLEKVAAPAGTSWADKVTKSEDGGYVMGNPDAPIKLIEFASLTCPHCAQFSADAGEELRETFVNSGRVSFEFRNFVGNPLDLTMAMMVRCGAPESFFALTSQTFQNQQHLVEAWVAAGEQAANQAAALPPGQRYNAMAQLAGLPAFYAARGIAADQAKQCLADGAAAEKLVGDTSKQGEQYGITGTPSFLLNGSKLDVNTWPEVKAALENAGAR